MKRSMRVVSVVLLVAGVSGIANAEVKEDVYSNKFVRLSFLVPQGQSLRREHSNVERSGLADGTFSLGDLLKRIGLIGVVVGAILVFITRKYRKTPSGQLSGHAIARVVRHLNVKAHSIRGSLANGNWVYQKWLKLIEDNFDDELEKAPGLVQAVCRSVIRIPYSTDDKWTDARKMAIRIIESMSSGSAPGVRAAAAEEMKWLESSSDDEIKEVTPANGSDSGTPREEAVKRVKYLRDVVAWLEAGKPAESKPEFKHPELKDLGSGLKI